MRTILNTYCALACLVVASVAAGAQEDPARRLASIVGVAVEEYEKGIDSTGHLISEQEYSETVGFLVDAKAVAGRLPGERAPAVRASLDSLEAAVAARRPPAELKRLHSSFEQAIGAAGALQLPRQPLDLAAGRGLFVSNCVTCHGERGMGDGPQARTMSPPPESIGSADKMADATPAFLFRVLSVGVPGTRMPSWSAMLSPQQRWNVVAYLHTLRATTGAVLEGEGLFQQRCASCHGALGGNDGPVTRTLTRLPPELGGLAWQVDHSDAQIAAAIRRGVAGSAMPAARELPDSDVAKLVAYVRTLPVRRSDAALAQETDSTAEGISRRVLRTLDQALAAAQGGRTAEAGDRAFDAYIAFEPLESSRAKNPGLVAAMERHFADFKGAVKSNDLRAAQRERDAIEAGLPDIVDLTRPTGDAWSSFWQSFLIVLREGFEAILVIGAVVAFLIKTGHRDRLRSIWLGAGLAMVASAVTAVVLKTVLGAIPASREILEGLTLLLAVAVLFSVSYWLISKVEAARWQQFIRDKVNTALEHGGGTALALVAFLAVYREGAETALFFQALYAEGTHVVVPISLGILAGLAALSVIFTLFYRYGVRIPLRPFFTVTSGLLYYMAFVFMGKGVRELQEGNAVPITTIPGFPHVEAMGIFPTVETLLAQLVLVALFVFALVKTFWPRRAVTLPTSPIATAAAVPSQVSEVLAQLERLQEATVRLETRVAELEREVTRPEVRR
jgi:high-affinity iron transporter